MPAAKRPVLYLVASVDPDDHALRQGAGRRGVNRFRLALGMFEERVTLRSRRIRGAASAWVGRPRTASPAVPIVERRAP